MPFPLRRWSALLLSLLLLLAVAGFALAQSEGATRQGAAPISPDGFARSLDAANSARTAVIVGLRPDSGLTPFAELSAPMQQQAVARAAARLLADPVLRGAADVQRYDYFPLLALTLADADIESLRAHPDVAFVARDTFRAPALDQSTLEIGAAGYGGAWEAGHTGQGQTIAVLDSGVDLAHSFLANKVVAEACYGTVANEIIGDGVPFIVSPVCPGGVTAATGPGTGVNCAVPGGECDHGTHVAGIAAGKGQDFSGVAPDANLIAVQVFSRVDSAWCRTESYPFDSCILAADSDIIKGLDYVYGLRDSYSIAAVNMSLGGGTYGSIEACEADQNNAAYLSIAAQFKAADIAVIASTGNDGRINEINGPACLRDIISVAASGNDGLPNSIWTGSNTSSFTDFVAPGFGINASVPGGGFADMTGTSMAAPHVAGAYAIMRGYRPAMTLAEIYEALHETGVEIEDSGSIYKSIRVNAGIAYTIIPSTPSLVGPDDAITVNRPGITFTWTTGTDTLEYRVLIDDAANNRLVSQVMEHNACDLDTGTCTLTVDDALPDNQTVTWRVRAKSILRTADSPTRTIAVDYPGAPTLLGPQNGSNYAALDEIGAFSWQPVTDATDYRFVVWDVKSDSRVVRVDMTAASACDAGTCSYSLSEADRAALKLNRSYDWWVQARSELGESDAAAWRFDTRFPGPPVLMAPDADSLLTLPSQLDAFTFQAARDVPVYRLTVRNTDTGDKVVNRKVQAVEVCNVDDQCSVALTAAEKDAIDGHANYKWWVKSITDLGNTNSEKRAFTTQMPAAPVLLGPGDAITINDPAQLSQITWVPVPEVTTYRVVLKDTKNKKNAVKADLTVGQGAICDAEQCSAVLSPADVADLRAGRTYKWFVQSRTPYGSSKSEKRRLTTDFPGAPSLVSPADGSTVRDMAADLGTMQWSAVEYATSYQLIVQQVRSGRPNKRVAKVKVTLGDAALSCDAQTCTYSVGPQVSGVLKHKKTYRWLVKAVSDYGKSKSAAQRFSVKVPKVDTVTLLDPADGTTLNAAADLAEMRWTPAANADSYRVIVQQVRTGRPNKTVYKSSPMAPSDPALTCDAQACAYAVPDALRSALKDGKNYKWFVRSSNPRGSEKSSKFTLKARF